MPGGQPPGLPHTLVQAVPIQPSLPIPLLFGAFWSTFERAHTRGSFVPLPAAACSRCQYAAVAHRSRPSSGIVLWKAQGVGAGSMPSLLFSFNKVLSRHSGRGRGISSPPLTAGRVEVAQFDVRCRKKHDSTALVLRDVFW